MLRKCITYLFLIVHIHQSKALTKSALAGVHLKEMYKKNPECKKIQCPPISDPICVRMKYVTSALQAKTVYVIMVNRCEIKYVTCYKGAEVKELPMKYCGHEDSIMSEKKKKQHFKSVTAEPLAEPVAEPLPIIVRRRRAVHIEEDGVQAQMEENDKEKKAQELHHLNDAKAQIMMTEDKKKLNSYKGDNSSEQKLSENKTDVVTEQKLKANIEDRSIEQPDPFYVIHSGSGEHGLEEVNFEQYGQSCPTVCPARGVMVCGKCKCGVYRTFVSACHMRMFDCAHPDEKLTVVAWAPCTMSGPYLEDLHEPKGLIDWPNDKDEVLNYFKCKEYAEKRNLFPYSRLNCSLGLDFTPSHRTTRLAPSW
ncbi:hypothetical protein NE865_02423 [Phthorimaea operculella]|nr:hypothetical protein NE865_02423 [Phthorimaea operculella]